MIYTCYTSHTMHILCKHISIYIYIVIQDMSYRYGSIFYRSRYIIVICKSRWAGKPMDKDKQKWCKISVECLAIDVVDLSLSLGKLIAWAVFFVWIRSSRIRGWTSAPQDGNFGQEHSCPSQSLAVFIFFYILDLYYIYYSLSYNRFQEHISYSLIPSGI